MSLPSGVLIANETWQVVQGVRDNGPGISGQTQRVQTGGLPWRVSYELIIPEAVVLAWNVWITRQRDGIIPVMLGPTLYRSEALQYYADDGGFSDSTEFSDGTGFAVDLDPAVAVTLSGAHAAGVVEIEVESFGLVSTAARFTAGQYLGIGDRLYRITTVTAGDPANQFATLGIWPPLRAALSNGADVDSPPKTKMRIEQKGSGPIPDRAYGAARLSMSFLEYLGDRAALS